MIIHSFVNFQGNSYLQLIDTTEEPSTFVSICNMPKSNDFNGNSRKFITQASLDSYVWSICDILRRSNCAGALQYIPSLLREGFAGKL